VNRYREYLLGHSDVDVTEDEISDALASFKIPKDASADRIQEGRQYMKESLTVDKINELYVQTLGMRSLRHDQAWVDVKDLTSKFANETRRRAHLTHAEAEAEGGTGLSFISKVLGAKDNRRGPPPEPKFQALS